MEIVEKLHGEINAGLADPNIVARLTDAGVTILALSRADFSKFVADETTKWAKVIRAANIRPDKAGFLYLTPEGVARDFAPDLPAAQTNVMAATQGPIFGKAFDEKVTNAAWKIKPSWFIVAEKERGGSIQRP